MSRFTPWNQHPRACVIPSTEYDITNESDRVKASMAGILANVWIFNTALKARKEWNFIGPMPKKFFTVSDVVITIAGQHTHLSSQGDFTGPPPAGPNFRCVAIQICCHKCGALKVGLLDGLCFNCRP